MANKRSIKCMFKQSYITYVGPQCSRMLNHITLSQIRIHLINPRSKLVLKMAIMPDARTCTQLHALSTLPTLLLSRSSLDLDCKGLSSSFWPRSAWESHINEIFKCASSYVCAAKRLLAASQTSVHLFHLII